MKRLALSVVAVVAISQIATAGGDMMPAPMMVPVAAPVEATQIPTTATPGNFYVGASGSRAIDADVRVKDLAWYNPGPMKRQTYTANGWIGSAYAGYDWKLANYILGVEGEVGYMDLSKDSQDPKKRRSAPKPGDSVASIDTDMLVGLYGRLGYTFENTLFYLKGGLVGVHADVSFKDSYNADASDSLVSGTSTSGMLWGTGLGGGIEYSLTPNIALRAEYMYMNFDDSLVHSPMDSVNNVPWPMEHELGDIDTVKAGVNYKF